MSSRACRAVVGALSLLAASLSSPAGAAPPTDCDRCFAIVRVDGTLARKRNVTANYRHATGTYEIVFKYPVTNCVVTVQIENTIASAVVNRGSTIGNPSNRSVSIYTFAPDGGPRGSAFGVQVTC